MEIIYTAGFVAALVSAVVTIWQTQRRISIENITQDRREWRRKIRRITPEIYDAFIDRDEESLSKLRTQLRIMLNPDDDMDKEITSCICLPVEGKETDYAEEFGERIALLLKHDWERAKLEAGPVILRIKCVHDVVKASCFEPERIKYKKC